MSRKRSIWGTAILFMGLLALCVAVFAADAPGAAAKSPPGDVGSVSVSRADGSLTAFWPAVAGADSYHVTYSTDGMQSWSLAAFSHGSNSITIGADNAKTYVVGVRARNADGWSVWINSAAAGPYVPPPPAPPAAVASVSTTRADGTLTASWDASSGATKYHVTYSSDWGQSWTAAADAHTGTSITISADNAEAYTIGVRAGNAGGWSGWTNSPTAHSWFPPARGIRIQDADGNAITSLAVPEGGEASYQVVLTAPPTETTKVCVYISVRDKNDPDITFKGEAADVVSIDVIFTPDNWNVPQTVTLVAAEDADYANGARDSGLDARDYYAGKVDLAVTEIDNDAPPAPASVTVTRADGTLTVSGYAVSGASTYHITYSSDGKQSWTAASDSHTGNSITISGIDNDATYHVGVRAGADGGWSAWTNSAAAGPYDPPAAPTGLTVVPSGASLDVSWTAVSGATGYDVRSSADGSTWTTEHSNVSGTSVSVANANDAIEHIGVRARNASSASAWTEISRMPADDWLTTIQPVQQASASGGLQMAAAQSGASAQSKLTAPTLGTITRDNGTRANGYDQSITVNWTAVTGAIGYQVACSATGGWSWWPCGTTRFNESRTVTIDNGDSGNDLGRYRSYRVGVRAVNDNHNDASDWTDSVDIRPVAGKLFNLASTRGNGSITLSWSPSPWTTGYQIHCAEADMTPPYSASVYTLCATLTGQVDTATSHSVTIPHSTNSTYTVDNAKTYDIKIVSTNQWGQGEWLAPLVFPITLTASNLTATGATLTISGYSGDWYYKSTTTGQTTCAGPVSGGATQLTLVALTPGTSYIFAAYSDSGCTNLLATAASFTTLSTLTASNVAATGATLTIANHTGDWYYKYTSPSGGTCSSSAVTGTSTTVTLTANTSYTFAAYSDSSCSTLVATAAAFSTPAAPVSVSNLSESGGTTTFVTSAAYAQEFGTGGNSGGYTLTSVTLGFSAVIDGTGFTASIRAKQSNGHPATTDLTTLSGTPVGQTQVTFTCSSSCDLSASTDYFIYVTGGNVHMATTNSNNETLTPSGNGWSIANGTRYQQGSWALDPSNATMRVKVTATPKPSLSSSSVSATGATLTIANHGGNWYYKSTTTGKTTCTGPVSGASVNVTGLTGGTAYTFSAYSDSGCTSGKLLATAASFTVPYSAPGAPTGLGRSGWVLSWTAPSDTGNGSGGITKYEVQCKRSINTSTVNTLTGSPPATSVTLTHQHCTHYSSHGNYARVRAFNGIWGSYSGWYRLQ